MYYKSTRNKLKKEIFCHGNNKHQWNIKGSPISCSYGSLSWFEVCFICKNCGSVKLEQSNKNRIGPVTG